MASARQSEKWPRLFQGACISALIKRQIRFVKPGPWPGRCPGRFLGPSFGPRASEVPCRPTAITDWRQLGHLLMAVTMRVTSFMGL